MDVTYEHRTGYIEMICTRDEIAAIMMAIESQKEALLKTVEDALGTFTSFEDQAFCFSELARLSKIQFDIKENHEKRIRDQVELWLDV